MANDSNMSFLEHLEELRWHIIRSLLAVLVFTIVAFIFPNILFDSIILAPTKEGFITNRLFCHLGELTGFKESLCINKNFPPLINTRAAGQFTLHISSSLIAGIIVAFPYIFWEFWRFLSPALKSNERRYARGSVFFSSMLFFMGVAFGYWVISPLTINFLGGYTITHTLDNLIDIRSYITTVTSVVLAAGVVFELPVLIYFLSKIGLVTPDFLRKYRRHAIVIILALSALITPPDIFSQFLVGIPLVILYEVGIGISKRIKKSHDREALLALAEGEKESEEKMTRRQRRKTRRAEKKKAAKKSD